MVTVSPPVSPSVVARIFTIQKPSVTAGTFVRASFAISRSLILSLQPGLGEMPGAAARSELRQSGAAGSAGLQRRSRFISGQTSINYLIRRGISAFCGEDDA